MTNPQRRPGQATFLRNHIIGTSTAITMDRDKSISKSTRTNGQTTPVRYHIANTSCLCWRLDSNDYNELGYRYPQVHTSERAETDPRSLSRHRWHTHDDYNDLGHPHAHTNERVNPRSARYYIASTRTTITMTWGIPTPTRANGQEPARYHIVGTRTTITINWGTPKSTRANGAAHTITRDVRSIRSDIDYASRKTQRHTYS